MATRKRYTDEERASLIVMLQAAGYPDKIGALKEVSDYSGVNVRVLRRWWLGTQNPPPDKLVRHKKLDMKKAIDDELSSIFTAMKTARADATYRDLGVVAGIMMDKQQLLNDKPTERIEHTGTLTVDERRARVAELLDRARTRRD